MNKQHNLWYQSSYDRGLEHILTLWPKIKKEVPDATLSICYGWDVFDVVNANNPERQEWKRRMVDLMKQDGIIEHGKISNERMKELREQCGIWAYPTHFTETFCITAIECQLQGLVPVTMALAALKETVFAGALVDGDIYDSETKEEWLKALIHYMSDETAWKEAQAIGKEKAQQFGWDSIAQQWVNAFNQ